jgi:hypothetical protein
MIVIVIVIEAGGRAHDVDDAAQIWAEATAARDGADDVPGLDISRPRPVIQGVLDRSRRALLLIARTADNIAGGFAVTEPLDGVGTTRAEVRYLGVRPDMWGQGMGDNCCESYAPGSPPRASPTPGSPSTQTTPGPSRSTSGWMAPLYAPFPHPRTGKAQQRYEVRL